MLASVLRSSLVPGRVLPVSPLKMGPPRPRAPTTYFPPAYRVRMISVPLLDPDEIVVPFSPVVFCPCLFRAETAAPLGSQGRASFKDWENSPSSDDGTKYEA